MSKHCEHGIQAGIPCGYCIRDARIATLESLAREAGAALQSAAYEWIGTGQVTPECRYCEKRNYDHTDECPYGIALTKLDAAGLLPGKEGQDAN